MPSNITPMVTIGFALLAIAFASSVDAFSNSPQQQLDDIWDRVQEGPSESLIHRSVVSLRPEELQRVSDFRLSPKSVLICKQWAREQYETRRRSTQPAIGETQLGRSLASLAIYGRPVDPSQPCDSFLHTDASTADLLAWQICKPLLVSSRSSSVDQLDTQSELVRARLETSGLLQDANDLTDDLLQRIPRNGQYKKKNNDGGWEVIPEYGNFNQIAKSYEDARKEVNTLKTQYRKLKNKDVAQKRETAGKIISALDTEIAGRTELAKPAYHEANQAFRDAKDVDHTKDEADKWFSEDGHKKKIAEVETEKKNWQDTLATLQGRKRFGEHRSRFHDDEQDYQDLRSARELREDARKQPLQRVPRNGKYYVKVGDQWIKEPEANNYNAKYIAYKQANKDWKKLTAERRALDPNAADYVDERRRLTEEIIAKVKEEIAGRELLMTADYQTKPQAYRKGGRAFTVDDDVKGFKGHQTMIDDLKDAVVNRQKELDALPPPVQKRSRFSYEAEVEEEERPSFRQQQDGFDDFDRVRDFTASNNFGWFGDEPLLQGVPRNGKFYVNKDGNWVIEPLANDYNTKYQAYKQASKDRKNLSSQRDQLDRTDPKYRQLTQDIIAKLQEEIAGRELLKTADYQTAAQAFRKKANGKTFPIEDDQKSITGHQTQIDDLRNAVRNRQNELNRLPPQKRDRFFSDSFNQQQNDFDDLNRLSSSTFRSSSSTRRVDDANDGNTWSNENRFKRFSSESESDSGSDSDRSSFGYSRSSESGEESHAISDISVTRGGYDRSHTASNGEGSYRILQGLQGVARDGNAYLKDSQGGFQSVGFVPDYLLLKSSYDELQSQYSKLMQDFLDPDTPKQSAATIKAQLASLAKQMAALKAERELLVKMSGDKYQTAPQDYWRKNEKGLWEEVTQDQDAADKKALQQAIDDLDALLVVKQNIIKQYGINSAKDAAAPHVNKAIDAASSKLSSLIGDNLGGLASKAGVATPSSGAISSGAKSLGSLLISKLQGAQRDNQEAQPGQFQRSGRYDHYAADRYSDRYQDRYQEDQQLDMHCLPGIIGMRQHLNLLTNSLQETDDSVRLPDILLSPISRWIPSDEKTRTGMAFDPLA